MTEVPSVERRPAIFLDGWSLAETPVWVTVSSAQLCMFDDAGRQLRAWSVAELSCDAMQEGGVIYVTHASASQETLIVRGPALEKQVLTVCGQVQSLPGGTRKLRFGLACLALLAALGATNYYAMPKIASAIAHRIPLEEERALGAQVESLLDFSRCSDEAGDAVLAKLMQRLGGKRASAYELRLIDLDVPNAFALPGGIVMMTDELVTGAESPAEVAGVLAHEIEHIEQRHVLTGVIRDTLLSAMWAITFSDYAGLLVVDPSTAYRVANLEFSRDDERAADSGAVRRLHAAGFSHYGLIDFFERIQEELGEDGPDWLSTHPHSEDRVAVLRATKDVAKAREVLSPEEFEVLRQACIDEDE